MIAWLVTSLLLVAAPRPADVVSGVVRDPAGATVAGAVVVATVPAPSDAGPDAQTVTGPDGRFSLDVSAPGPIVVTVRAGGFAEYVRTLSESDRTQRLDVMLSLAPLSETITVTSTRGEQRAGDVPASINVLSGEQIRLSPAVVADDVLRQVPTFSLFRRSSSLSSHPTTQGVSLRGIGPSGVSRTLVLMDGIPFNDPFGGWVYWTRVPLASVDRVELVDGANSSLYGSYAMGGVVNILGSRPARRTLELGAQYGNLANWHWVPIGDTWYESLQLKATKRVTHGLEFGSAFTWAKQLTSGVEDDFGRGGGVVVNDVFNRRNQKALSSYDQPFQFVISGSYTTPRWLTNGAGPKAVSWLARDWQIGTLLRYASGLPIASPSSTNSLATYLFQGTLFNRVPGVPLFTQDLNCHCFDPSKTFVLNPAAWSNPSPGQWGTAAAYYSDYRYQRRPVENLSLGRNFRIRERASFQVRAEFTNVFNRTEATNPTATNALATQTRNAAGLTTAGFGYVNTAAVFSAPRQGQLVARFSF